MVSHNPLLSLSLTPPCSLQVTRLPPQSLRNAGTRVLSRAMQVAAEPSRCGPSTDPGALSSTARTWAPGPRVCGVSGPVPLNPHQGQATPHRGSDVGLGLPKLLPQPLCQRSDGILGSTVEMGHGLGWHLVARHAGWKEGRGKERVKQCPLLYQPTPPPGRLLSGTSRGHPQGHWPSSCNSSSICEPHSS